MVLALLPGGATLLLIALLTGGCLGALLLTAGEVGLGRLWHDAYVWQVVRFSLWQATLSTLLSVGLALPVARALARRRFPGRGLVLRLMGLPLVVPTIVAVVGVIAVLGRRGWINEALAALGLERLDIYGLRGILVAHVFFNLPLATRLLVQGWDGIPRETWRQAAQLGMRSRHMLRLIEWPMLKEIVPGVAGLVFMLCFTSFAVVLILGGGPGATTIEVAIYQALRFEFDLARVVLLALLQLSICLVLVGIGQRLARPPGFGDDLDRPSERPDLTAWPGRIGDGLALASALLLLALPLAAVLARGLGGPINAVLGDPELWAAALRSLAVALSAAALAVLLGLGLLVTGRALRQRARLPGLAALVELPGLVVLVVPPFVIGTGLFVLLRPVVDVFAFGLVVVAIVNAVMGLPYVMRILGPPFERTGERHGRLCASLGIRGWHRARLVEWPPLRRPLGLAMGLVAALSVGDLGVIALFGSPGTVTLPFHLYQLMAGYRMDEAAVTAVVLVTFCLLIFVVLERGVGGRA
jgi:thiamine transport system permease protein